MSLESVLEFAVGTAAGGKGANTWWAYLLVALAACVGFGLYFATRNRSR